MKNKPIKEGFKFFALCDAKTGYVFSFMPDGQVETNTIAKNIEELVIVLPENEKGYDRIKQYNSASR